MAPDRCETVRTRLRLGRGRRFAHVGLLRIVERLADSDAEHIDLGNLAADCIYCGRRVTMFQLKAYMERYRTPNLADFMERLQAMQASPSKVSQYGAVLSPIKRCNRAKPACWQTDLQTQDEASVAVGNRVRTSRRRQ